MTHEYDHDIYEYKGCYIDDNEEDHCFEGGAHFKYEELYNALLQLEEEKKSLEINKHHKRQAMSRNYYNNQSCLYSTAINNHLNQQIHRDNDNPSPVKVVKQNREDKPKNKSTTKNRTLLNIAYPKNSIYSQKPDVGLKASLLLNQSSTLKTRIYEECMRSMKNSRNTSKPKNNHLYEYKYLQSQPFISKHHKILKETLSLSKQHKQFYKKSPNNYEHNNEYKSNTQSKTSPQKTVLQSRNITKYYTKISVLPTNLKNNRCLGTTKNIHKPQLEINNQTQNSDSLSHSWFKPNKTSKYSHTITMNKQKTKNIIKKHETKSTLKCNYYDNRPNVDKEIQFNHHKLIDLYKNTPNLKQLLLKKRNNQFKSELSLSVSKEKVSPINTVNVASAYNKSTLIQKNKTQLTLCSINKTKTINNSSLNKNNNNTSASSINTLNRSTLSHQIHNILNQSRSSINHLKSPVHSNYYKNIKTIGNK